MEVLYDRVAGLDVGKASLTVCVRTPGARRRRHQETRTFKTTTGSLLVMRDWLLSHGVTQAAMESTSTYWKPGRGPDVPNHPTAGRLGSDRVEIGFLPGRRTGRQRLVGLRPDSGTARRGSAGDGL